MIFSGNLDVLYALCNSSPTVDGAAVSTSLVVMLQQQYLAEAFIKRNMLRKLKKDSSKRILSLSCLSSSSHLFDSRPLPFITELGKDGIVNVFRDNT